MFLIFLRDIELDWSQHISSVPQLLLLIQFSLSLLSMAMYCFMYMSPALSSFMRFLCFLSLISSPCILSIFSFCLSTSGCAHPPPSLPQSFFISVSLPSLSRYLSLYPPALSSFPSHTHIHLIFFTDKHTCARTHAPPQHTPFLFLVPSHRFSHTFPFSVIFCLCFF